MRSPDTSADAQRAQLEVWRRMSPERRLELVVEMSEQARELAADGIRHRHPEYTESQVQLSLRRLVLGDALFRKAWPDAPRLEA